MTVIIYFNSIFSLSSPLAHLPCLCLNALTFDVADMRFDDMSSVRERACSCLNALSIDAADMRFDDMSSEGAMPSEGGHAQEK